MREAGAACEAQQFVGVMLDKVPEGPFLLVMHEVYHMLVLILDWLLAGVSSPWLPSLGGDCNKKTKTHPS